MTFETALTGLNAASADLDVTGNNIANSSTVGFKYSRAEFADIFASSTLGVSQNAIGQGVRLAKVAQQHTQGQFSFTGNSLDLAINGSGFFRMSDDGQVSYTRAGSFTLDRDGYIIDNGGRRLTGYLAGGDGRITASSVQEIQIETGDIDPEPTRDLKITANMMNAAEVPANDFATSLDPANPTAAPDPSTYNFSTSTTVYDSQGRAHAMSLYFVKTASNNWDVYSQLAGHEAGVQGPAQVEFDGQGRPVGAPSSTFTFSNTSPPLTGADSLSVDMDLSDLTQFGTPFSVTQLDPSGYAAGQFSGMTVEQDGTITARYTNGQSNSLGRVALSTFPSPQNLQQIGDTNWVETFASGAPINAQPGSSGLGNLQSGSLEQSNVNVTEQLIKMITAQRNYQANAKMISTQDAITQEVLKIR